MVKQGRLTIPYGGIRDCYTRIVATEGIRSLWRGNLVNCIRYFPTQLMMLSFKPSLQYQFMGDIDIKRDGYGKWFRANMAVGAVAGGATMIVTYPLDYAHLRLANDVRHGALISSGSSSSKPAAAVDATARGGSYQFKGIFDVYRHSIMTDGIHTLYRGFLISLAGVVVYRGCYFGLYDSLKPFVINNANSFAAAFTLGWAVTVAASMIAYPLDTVRRRIMMTGGTTVNGTPIAKYATIFTSFDCARAIISKEGTRALWHGASANIVRGIAGALVLSGFDRIQSAV